MKILAIDAGNTRIKWGIKEAQQWLHTGAIATADAGALRAELATAPQAESVVVANVAGNAVRDLINLALPSDANAQWVVSRSEQCGVRSGYADPRQLGPDRWAALIGARDIHADACVVVNVGTTMTVDALSADGVFLGGFIVAGFELMRGALARNTAQLKEQEGKFSFFPDNTGDAIVSGAVNALTGAVERMVRYVTETTEADPTVIVSGGSASMIVPLLSGHIEHIDNLVLEGLAVIGAGESDG